MTYDSKFKVTELINDNPDAFIYLIDGQVFVDNGYAAFAIENKDDDDICGISGDSIAILEKRAKAQKRETIFIDTDTKCEILCVDKSEKMVERAERVYNNFKENKEKVNSNFSVRINMKTLEKISKFLGEKTFDLFFEAGTDNWIINASVMTEEGDVDGLVQLTNPMYEPEEVVEMKSSNQTTLYDFIDNETLVAAIDKVLERNNDN